MRLSTLGLVSLIASALAAPAFAGTPASVSGSTTFITPAGFTSTVSGGSVLPSGFVYQTTAPTFTPQAAGANTVPALTNEAVSVVPSTNVLGFAVTTTSLRVGSSAPASFAPGTSFSASAAAVLTNAAAAVADTALPFTAATQERAIRNGTAVTYASGNIDFISAIIKAGAGVNGLD